MRVFAAIILGGLVSTAISPARADDACRAFAWPLERELAWFSDAKMPVVESSGTAKSGGAVVVKLAPMSQVKFAMAPERAPKTPDTFGGVVTIAPAAAGLVQITLSEEAWVDVIQNDVRAKSAAFSGKQGCPGIRKSVRFEVTNALLVIQISGSAVDHLKMAIAPTE